MRKRKKKTSNPPTTNPLTDSPLHFARGIRALETVRKPILNLSPKPSNSCSLYERQTYDGMILIGTA